MLKEKTITLISGGITALIALICLGLWLSANSAPDLELHLPGRDGRPEGRGPGESVAIGKFFQAGQGVAADLPGSWPRFRGENFDNIVSGGPALLQDASRAPLLWEIPLGEGHAGPVVFEGRVYLLDYDEEAGRDVMSCFSLADGRQIWSRGYQVKVKRNHGMSRSVPAVSPEGLVSIGPLAHVMALDPLSGDFRWGFDLVREFGSKVPDWYTAQCPLIKDGVVVIAPAGDEVLLMGVDCKSGEILWKTPNPHGWKMSHSSVMFMSLEGKPMFVYAALGGVVGVSAAGEDAGLVLWESKDWNFAVVAPSPVIFPDGRIFLTAGYGAGSMMLQVSGDGVDFSVKTLFQNTPRQGFACEQQTPILFEGHLFGITPKDGGADRNQFVCYDGAGNRVWGSGKTRRFGLGPWLLADGKFFILHDTLGEVFLTVAEASTTGYRELSHARIGEGVDAWGPLALAENRLLLRTSRRLICLDMGAK